MKPAHVAGRTDVAQPPPADPRRGPRFRGPRGHDRRLQRPACDWRAARRPRRRSARRPSTRASEPPWVPDATLDAAHGRDARAMRDGRDGRDDGRTCRERGAPNAVPVEHHRLRTGELFRDLNAWPTTAARAGTTAPAAAASTARAVSPASWWTPRAPTRIVAQPRRALRGRPRRSGRRLHDPGCPLAGCDGVLTPLADGPRQGCCSALAADDTTIFWASGDGPGTLGTACGVMDALRAHDGRPAAAERPLHRARSGQLSSLDSRRHLVGVPARRLHGQPHGPHHQPAARREPHRPGRRRAGTGGYTNGKIIASCSTPACGWG